MRRGKRDRLRGLYVFLPRKTPADYAPYGSDFNEGWRLAVWVFAGPIVFGLLGALIATGIVLMMIGCG